jgi:hypothetical protein
MDWAFWAKIAQNALRKADLSITYNTQPSRFWEGFSF